MLLCSGAGSALRWAPIRYAVLRESQSRSRAKGARVGTHGGGSPRIEQADTARRAPIVRSLWSLGRFHHPSSWRWAVVLLGVHTPSKNPRPVSRKESQWAVSGSEGAELDRSASRVQRLSLLDLRE